MGMTSPNETAVNVQAKMLPEDVKETEEVRGMSTAFPSAYLR